jgi:hypothetical protein
MKKILVLSVIAAFLYVGCAGEKSGEAKKDETKKVEVKKDEAKPEAKPEETSPEPAKAGEETPETKPEGALGGETGEALWKKSCDHATKLILASSDMNGMPAEARASMEKELPGECLMELVAAGGAAADESAACMLALSEFTPKAFSNCEPKGGAEKPEVETK